MRTTIDPNAAAYLIERYPSAKRAGLATMWTFACDHVTQCVRPEYRHASFAQAALEAAALLRVTAICTGGDPIAKQAMLLASAELVAPFC